MTYRARVSASTLTIRPMIAAVDQRPAEPVPEPPLQSQPVSAPMREFLAWVAFRPRTHADAMDAWQSHCPRFTVWEDALEADLVDLEPGAIVYGSARVRLTPRGRAALASRD
jgi:hypothetical protein